jgi:CRISPR system Cascade subunit CasE
MNEEIYLSRLILNPRSREVQGGLRDCQKLHCMILKAFPKVENQNKKAREEFGVLYRVDVDRKRNRLSLLVQSRIAPDWSRLPDEYLLEDVDELNPSCKTVHELFKTLQEGMRLRFRLRANPTRRLNEEPKDKESNTKKRGRRVDIRGEKEQSEWLKRKEQDCGFRLTALRLNSNVANVNVGPEQNVKGKKCNSDAKMIFGSVLFDGELIITDAKQFQSALISGIGSGKAYGFGLLSIARA